MVYRRVGRVGENEVVVARNYRVDVGVRRGSWGPSPLASTKRLVFLVTYKNGKSTSIGPGVSSCEDSDNNLSPGPSPRTHGAYGPGEK